MSDRMRSLKMEIEGGMINVVSAPQEGKADVNSCGEYFLLVRVEVEALGWRQCNLKEISDCKVQGECSQRAQDGDVQNPGGEGDEKDERCVFDREQTDLWVVRSD